MRAGRIQEVAATIWFGLGAAGGFLALDADSEATRAGATAAVLEAQDDSRAAEWRTYADSQEGVAYGFVSFVGVAAVNGSAAAYIAFSRRREQGPEASVSVQESA